MTITPRLNHKRSSVIRPAFGRQHSMSSPDEPVRLTYYVTQSTMVLLIRTFRCNKTQRLFERERVKEFAGIASVAVRRLVALDSAQRITDLLVPPSNRLEALTGDRKGEHSIRINDQYRICFTWRDGNADNVEITKHYR